MLPVQIRIKVSIQSPTSFVELWMFCCSLKREKSNKHAHSRKIPCLLSFCSHFQVTLNFVHHSRVKYILIRMCSQLMYLQRRFHEGCRILNTFNPVCIVRKDQRPPTDPCSFKIVLSSKALLRNLFSKATSPLFASVEWNIHLASALECTGYTQYH